MLRYALRENLKNNVLSKLLVKRTENSSLWAGLATSALQNRLENGLMYGNN